MVFYMQASIAEGIGSSKAKVLADSAVTLARGDSGLVIKDVINRIIKGLLHTRDHPSKCLEQHVLWVELSVLSQFLLNLSFNSSMIG